VALHPPRAPFGRRLFGYRRADVDDALDRHRREIATLRSELDHLRGVDPFAAIGADVAGMLRALADSVGQTRERAEREAAGIVADALTEADRITADAEAFAESVIDEMLHDVEPRLDRANAARHLVARALVDVQAAVTTALEAVGAAGEIHLDLTVSEAALHGPAPVAPENGSANGSTPAPSAVTAG